MEICALTAVPRLPTNSTPHRALAVDDSVTFEDFYREHFSRTSRLAYLLTGSNTAADDLAQEALSQLYGRFVTLANPEAYLHTSTVNLCKNWKRSQASQRRLSGTIAGTSSGSEPPQIPLLDILAQLPYRQRAVLILRYWLGHTERDTAAILRCRLGTVKSLHSRALSTLREELR